LPAGELLGIDRNEFKAFGECGNETRGGGFLQAQQQISLGFIYELDVPRTFAAAEYIRDCTSC
jgi:hypothetical protein